MLGLERLERSGCPNARTPMMSTSRTSVESSFGATNRGLANIIFAEVRVAPMSDEGSRASPACLFGRPCFPTELRKSLSSVTRRAANRVSHTFSSMWHFWCPMAKGKEGLSHTRLTTDYKTNIAVVADETNVEH